MKLRDEVYLHVRFYPIFTQPEWSNANTGITYQAVYSVEALQEALSYGVGSREGGEVALVPYYFVDVTVFLKGFNG